MHRLYKQDAKQFILRFKKENICFYFFIKMKNTSKPRFGPMCLLPAEAKLQTHLNRNNLKDTWGGRNALIHSSCCKPHQHMELMQTKG